MAISLSDAQVNAHDDIDFNVIDLIRRNSWLLDQMTFDDSVSPGTGGATLVYGYVRVSTERGAAFRAIGSEYADTEAKRTQYTVTLHPLGGSYAVDRVLANLGAAATNEVAFQTDQLIKAIRARFQDELINGDVHIDANGFDGLDTALAGSTTETVPDSGSSKIADWTAATIDTEGEAHTAIDLVDEWLGQMDGTPTAILGNLKSITRLKSIARRAGYYSRSEDAFGQPVERYGDSVLLNLGAKAASSNPIVPIETRYDKWTLTVTATGGTFTITVDGHTTDPIAYNANDAAIKTAVEALPNVDTVTVSSKAITFTPLVVVTVDDSAATGGDVTVAGSNKGGSGLTDLYAVRLGLDGVHGASVGGSSLVTVLPPDLSTPGAVKRGEVEMGPVALAVRTTQAAAVLRNLKVQ